MPPLTFATRPCIGCRAEAAEAARVVAPPAERPARARALGYGAHPDNPGPFSLDDPERVRGLLERAGFVDVRAEEIAVQFDFRDVDECVTFATDTSGPMALVLQGLPAAERARVAGSLEAALAPFRTGAGYEVPGVSVVAVAA